MNEFNKKFEKNEWNNRLNLAACYHLADHFGFSDVIWNHITAKTSENKETFLINEFGLRYDEITASNLVEIDSSGNVIGNDRPINDTGFIIHGAIHKSRKDISCVMHTHSRAGLAISTLREGLIPMIQDAAFLYKRVSYHNWEGMSTQTEECERLAKSLGSNKVMILRNHGLLTCGETIAEAFMLMYYLDRACKNQIDVMSTGMKANIPTDNIMEYAAGQYEDSRFKLGEHEWPALLRILDKKGSIYTS
ncbi:MAG: Decarboxylase NovR [Alphaproteobacteria bacterium MarineAlpha5_Bin11]|nr:class II aldolase [Pelagibacteraceae bacterium]PPR43032.1 MAG: Decarboxylase NovR [Alphaproteobacteria bacterium MarineAlpha5_Bin11]|tara:strand:- start:8729 stop:9475 length:747 start_codon:yes stop_codon:yes gene_type:complete